MNKDPLYINNRGQPIYWMHSSGGLADWKEKIAVADLVYAFSDRQDTKIVGVITKLKWGGCPSDDSAVVKWLSNDPPMGKYQYLYNLYPIELAQVCE